MFYYVTNKNVCQTILDKLIAYYLEFKGTQELGLDSLHTHGSTLTKSPRMFPPASGYGSIMVPGSWARRHRVFNSNNQFDQNGLVGEVGIEPTLTALSRQCLRVYKARPKANISNSPNGTT